MTTWIVMKHHGHGGTTAGWVEVGTYESEHSYWLGPNAPEVLGKEHGAGEFLLLHDEKYKRITVAERTEFYEAEAKEPQNDEETVEQTNREET